MNKYLLEARNLKKKYLHPRLPPAVDRENRWNFQEILGGIDAIVLEVVALPFLAVASFFSPSKAEGWSKSILAYCDVHATQEGEIEPGEAALESLDGILAEDSEDEEPPLDHGPLLPECSCAAPIDFTDAGRYA